MITDFGGLAVDELAASQSEFLARSPSLTVFVDLLDFVMTEEVNPFGRARL
jgi:hypothetical protein